VLLEHDSTSSVAEPAGMATEFHVTPPSLVVTSNAVAEGSWATSGFPPIATHEVDDVHDTERRTPVPPWTVRALHVVPPLPLTSIDDPTDTQNVVVGQSTEPSAPKDAGNVGTLQVVPPLEETRSCPAKGPSSPGDTPTLTHFVELGQVTPSNVVFLVGSVYDVHVAPPSVERTDAPCPTATHSDALSQFTAFSTGSFESIAPWLQLPPPLLDVEATPPKLASPPTATHSVLVGQETALKLPLPVVAPPAVGTAGAPC
jgi:hypothetical protein